MRRGSFTHSPFFICKGEGHPRTDHEGPKLEQMYSSTLSITSALYRGGGPGSLVGIATGYGLDGPGIESRWEARFSAPVHTDPGAHPASCTMGTGSFQGVKSGRSVTSTPHLFLVPWSRRSRAILLLPLRAVRPVQSLSACTRVNFTFTFIWGWVVNVTFRPLYPQDRPGTSCTGGWVGPRAGLEECGKSRPHRDSIPGPSSP